MAWFLTGHRDAVLASRARMGHWHHKLNTPDLASLAQGFPTRGGGSVPPLAVVVHRPGPGADVKWGTPESHTPRWKAAIPLLHVRVLGRPSPARARPPRQCSTLARGHPLEGARWQTRTCFCAQDRAVLAFSPSLVGDSSDGPGGRFRNSAPCIPAKLQKIGIDLLAVILLCPHAGTRKCHQLCGSLS